MNRGVATKMWHARKGLPVVAMVAAGVVAGGGSVSMADAGPCGTAGVYAVQGSTASCTYSAAGADTFVPPDGVKAVTVMAVGGAGGTFPPPDTTIWSGGFNGKGGDGAEVTGTLSSPPSLLYVEVGVNGGDSIGHGGGTGGAPDGASGGLAGDPFPELGYEGSGGGGSSDVSSAPWSAGDLSGAADDPRLIVAGGGGGGGGGGENMGNGAVGGSAGASAIVGAGAGGACTDVGGAGGVGAGGGSAGTTGCNGAGVAGTAASGGEGGVGEADSGDALGGGGGGGGGGGFIGGGGGGGANKSAGGGGGGAGSSYTSPGVTAAAISTATSSQAPEVVISWPAPEAPHAPTDTVAPLISGTVGSGHEVTCVVGTWANSPTSYAYQWDLDGTPIAGATTASYLVPALDDGESLTCVVTATNATGTSAPASSGRALVPVPHVKRCPAATGGLSAKAIGALRLGMTRAQARHADSHSSTRGRASVDFFCFTPQGIRAGYASTKLLDSLPERKRAKYTDRVVWISTASAHYSIGTIRHGAALSYAATQLKLSPEFVVGANDWYLASLPAGGTGVLKVRGGVVQEIGIGTTAVVGTSHRAQRAFLSSFS